MIQYEQNINNNLPMFIIQSWKTQVLFLNVMLVQEIKSQIPAFLIMTHSCLMRELL